MMVPQILFRLCFWFVATLILAAVPLASLAANAIRDQEIAECRTGEAVTWADGQDRPAVANPLVFAYLPEGGPVEFSTGLVEGVVKRALAAWGACGVGASLTPTSSAALPPGAIRIQWNEVESRGNFALANLSRRTLALSPAMFAQLRRVNPNHDARETLQMALSHEIGHFFGLMAHSRRCVDVMSYYDDGRGGHCLSRNPLPVPGILEYRSALPTACDIERCRRINGLRNDAGIFSPRP